jgi:hypothetical protein
VNPTLRITERISLDAVTLGVKMFLPPNTRLEIVQANDEFVALESVHTGVRYSLGRPAYDDYLAAGALRFENSQLLAVVNAVN